MLENEKQFGAEYFLATLYVLAIGLSLPIGPVAGLAFFIIAIWSVVNITSYSINIFDDQITWFMAVATFPVALSSIMSYWLGESSQITWHKLALYFSYSMIIPIWYLLSKYRVNKKTLLLGFPLAAILGVIVGIYQIFCLNTGRASGSSVATLYGSISILLAFISISIYLFLPDLKKWERTLLIAGTISGLVASVLSGTRGAWIAAPVLSALILWSKRETLGTLKLVATGSLVLSIFIGVYAIPQTGVKPRIDQASSNILDFSRGSDKNTSVGQRLEYWRQSLNMIEQNWLVGIGPGNFGQQLRKKIIAGEAPDYLYSEPDAHPHNEYLYALTERGVIGLLTELLLFGIPLFIFTRKFRTERSYTSAAALSGIVVIIGMAIFGISDVTTAWPLTVIFYILSIALFMHTITADQAVRIAPKVS